VESLIDEYPTYVSPGSEVTAWTMLTNKNDRRNWAQVGWWEDYGGYRNTFTQWTPNPNDWRTTFFGARSAGSSTRYTVFYSDGYLKFYINSILKQAIAATPSELCAKRSPNIGRNTQPRRSDAGWYP